MLMHHVMWTVMMHAFLVQQRIGSGSGALLCHVDAPCNVNDDDAGLPCAAEHRLPVWETCCVVWMHHVRWTLMMQAFLVQQSIGFGFGSLLFHVGGVLMLARQARARCRPSVESTPGMALA